jgi:hypothetical protein
VLALEPLSVLAALAGSMALLFCYRAYAMKAPNV